MTKTRSARTSRRKSETVSENWKDAGKVEIEAPSILAKLFYTGISDAKLNIILKLWTEKRDLNLIKKEINKMKKIKPLK